MTDDRDDRTQESAGPGEGEAEAAKRVTAEEVGTPAAIGEDESDPAPEVGPRSDSAAASHLKAQFPDSQVLRARPVRFADLGSWRGPAADFPTAGTLPATAGVHVLASCDIRAHAALLRAAATPGDRVLDLEASGQGDDGTPADGHSLLQLLRLHLGDAEKPGRLAIALGIQARWPAFWEMTVRQAQEIRAHCEAAACTVFVLASDEEAARRVHAVPGLDVIEVDPRPLIEHLATGWTRSAERIDEIRRFLDGGQLRPAELIKALDAQDEELLDAELEAADNGRPFVEEARAFIQRRIADSDEPAEIAAAFTAACFDGLTSREFQAVAEALAETAGLVDPPLPAKEDEPVPPPRIRIREKVLADLEIGMRQRPSAGGGRMPLLVLKGTERYREQLREQLPLCAALTSAKLIEQMSNRLLHGVVAPQRWEPSCDVVGRIMLNETGPSEEQLGLRLAQFWLALADGAAGHEPLRTGQIVAHGEPMLRRFCARIAELGGLDGARLLRNTAIEMVYAARGGTPVTAWRIPAASDFVARALGTEVAADAEHLLKAALDGPAEVLTLLCASLTGCFGLISPAELDDRHLDTVLDIFAQLSVEADTRSEAVSMLAAGMTWHLASHRLAAEARRLNAGDPPAISDELSKRLVGYVVAQSNIGPGIFEDLPFRADWMNGTRFDALCRGWRNPPEHYHNPEVGRDEILAGEFAFASTMRTLEALTASRTLEPRAARQEVLAHFAAGMGLAHIPIETVALWLPEPFPHAEAMAHGGTTHPATGPQLREFRQLARRLRHATPLLAVAFSLTQRVEGDETGRALTSRVPSTLGEVIMDAKSWSALRTAADEVRGTLDLLLTRWRDALDRAPRSPAIRAATTQAMMRCSVFSTWWRALIQERAALT